METGDLIPTTGHQVEIRDQSKKGGFNLEKRNPKEENILAFLEEIEDLNNGPEGEEGFLTININRPWYISQLLADGFTPNERLIRLYHVWLFGEHTDWWCQIGATFPEFYSTLKGLLFMIGPVFDGYGHCLNSKGCM